MLKCNRMWILLPNNAEKGKNMALELFRYNLEAYEASVKLLREQGEAAVIRPTGTGKSFIAFRFCLDHSENRICWLSPSEHIFQTQLEKLRAASGECSVSDLCQADADAQAGSGRIKTRLYHPG